MVGWVYKEEDLGYKTLGRCHYPKKCIYMNIKFLKKASEDQIKEVMLHEIAHALVGWGNGHNRVFKNTCRRIGGHPNRLFPFDLREFNTIKVGGKIIKEGDEIMVNGRGGWQKGWFVCFHRGAKKYRFSVKTTYGQFSYMDKDVRFN